MGASNSRSIGHEGFKFEQYYDKLFGDTNGHITQTAVGLLEDGEYPSFEDLIKDDYSEVKKIYQDESKRFFLMR